MNRAWTPPPPRDPVPFGGIGWALIAVRVPVLAVVVFGGLLVLLALRLLERPLFGMHRPTTPYITQYVCMAALSIMGFRLRQRGQVLTSKGAIVANHTSWLDIFVLNSRQTLYFISKSEVARWPGIGWLAHATGTLFIQRDPREARRQAERLEARLLEGHKMLFFPEGTSTDGLRVLPFKSTLFAAFVGERLKHELHLQAVSVVYHAPDGQAEAFYGWWGDMAFGPSLLEVLAQPRQGLIDLHYHEPVRADAFPNRKTLASHLEDQMRGSHGKARSAEGLTG